MLKFTIPPVPGSVELTELAKAEALRSTTPMCSEARTLGQLAADCIIACGATPEDALQIGAELTGQISAVHTRWDYSQRASEAFGSGFEARIETVGVTA